MTAHHAQAEARYGQAFERQTMTGPVDGSQRGYRISCRWLPLCALLTAAGGMLASCDTPVGVSPALKGTYWEHAIVTNPYGGGPMEVRWGPPEPARVPDDN